MQIFRRSTNEECERRDKVGREEILIRLLLLEGCIDYENSFPLGGILSHASK